MFPIALKLAGRQVLLVGAGRVGRRKLEKIIKSGGRVRLVESTPDKYVRDLAESGQVELAAEFTTATLAGISLVFTASDDPQLNQAVANEARKLGIWVNMADDPAGSDFTLPALVERGDFCLTVSTGGASPALAAGVAEKLRALFGPEYKALTSLLAEIRPQVLVAGLSQKQREDVFRQLAESKEILAALSSGDEALARRLAANLMTRHETGR